MIRSLLLILAACLPLLAAGKLRVQIITGGHSHDLAFYSLFEGQDNLAVSVNPHPSAYRSDLRGRVDVLVLYDLHDLATDVQKKNLQDFLEAGGGLVVLHHALADNWQWKWWYEEVVGGRFLMGPEGAAPGSTAKAPVRLSVKPGARHPVLDGVDAFTVDDEGYKGMWLSPRSTPLLETTSAENDKVVAWIGPWPKSRVVAIQLGHGAGAYGSETYRRLVRNAIAWAAPSPTSRTASSSRE
ncbi:MAG: ThuA domain-containing protein [Candidatus Solibacter usitatus]|nr:ThuA domain-containing protein [Candidatus Solibacter usitatus]